MVNPILYRCRHQDGYMFRFKRPDNGKRTTLRLGVVTKKRAIEVGENIDEILECIKYDSDFPPRLFNWLSRLSPQIYDKFVRAGLLAPRETIEVPTLRPFLDAYADLKKGRSGRSGGWKAATAQKRQQSINDLIKRFGENKPLAEINAGDAEQWFQWMTHPKPEGRGLSLANASKKFKDARQFFEFAKKKGYIDGNPFSEMRVPAQDNPARLCEVPVESIQKVMAVIEDTEFRLILALARFAGLRIPSEVTQLRWRDINFEKGTMQIFASKTEHHRNGGLRICPLFAEVKPYLEALKHEDTKPDDFVLRRHRLRQANMRTQLARYIKKAGVDPWPKPFQNCRANALTDLAERHPIHIVCRWLGNTMDVALRHYVLIKKCEYQMPSSSPTIAT